MTKVLAFIILFFAAAGISHAAENDKATQHIKLTYKAYWGGFVISKVYSSGHMSPTDYAVEVSYKVTGLATIFSNMENKVTARGKFASDGSLKPLSYTNQGRWGKYSFHNRTEFQKEDSKIISHEFAFKFKEDVEYIPIREEHKYGPDMVSFYLGLSLDEEAMKIGEKIMHQNIFGGFFLLDISYQCTENKRLKSKRSVYKGDVLVCEFRDKIVDGSFKRIKKKKKSQKKSRKKKNNTDTMEPIPLEIWYGKVDGLDNMIPVYSEFSIGWGKVRVYLAEIEVTTE
ncbi:hypothetical protein MNBD_ALPHA03-2079 [hydrothermal vent metagenome]|uniref:DUF3108 domain-containing protein n=1 Tax=hydrothermal vent metagenome TaxID=652676 RepID=A0A3B1AY94_9ZZZZ